DVQVESGFHARYFDMDKSLSRLDDVDWDSAPAFDEVVQDINYTNSRGSFWEGGDTDTFAAEITGTIQVDEAGRFEFFLSGDDGARLYINGQPVVENDGLHSYRTRSGDIHLEPGLHHVEVQYFENYGFAGLRLEWDGPGTEGRTLVTPAGEADVQAISGMPTALQMSFPAGGPPDGTTVTLVGLPEGTQVAAAGDVGVVDASGAFDITGWDISLLTVEPPIDFVGLIDACVLVENVCGAEHRVPLTIDVGAAQPPAPSAAFVGGFQASYFDVGHSLRKVDDINWDSDPTHTEYIADINYANSRGSFWEGGPTDMFGVKVEGEIEVKSGGTYTFFAGGDDGVVVLIDGQPVVENDGLHGFRTRSGEIELEPGTYDIEVLYFENHGHSGLKLEWDGTDTDGRELLQAAPALEIAANGTFELALDVQGSSGASGVVIEGLPAGTIISSGDVAQIVDHQAVDVSQWDLSTIEISPPPGFEGVIEGSLVVTDTAFNGAPVTGATPFSLTVGDPQAGSDPLPDDGLTVSSADPHAAEDWGAPDLDTNLETSDDVMTERVVESGADDALQVSLDSYELSDL
ncbi:MAG: PA14 domain-containing protein, partial [Pseudomonadota bacterium]